MNITSLRVRSTGIVVISCSLLSLAPLRAGDLRGQADLNDATVEARLKKTVGYLASDELRGRFPGTTEIDLAADHIARRMKKIGLKTDLYHGTPYQHFRARVRNFQAESQSHWPALLEYIIRRVCDSLGIHNGLSQGKSGREKPAVEGPRPPPVGPIEMKNIVGVLEGQGPSAEETIVVGAHYDHLGMKKNREGQWEVCNGANDNASGVAVMLEAAEILARRAKRLPRRVVFVAFSGEESGLLGSFHYVNDPAVPLKKTIAMINLDMVGRLPGKLLVGVGAPTSPPLAQMAETAARRQDLDLLPIPGALAGSDHLPFYARNVPVIFFVTWGGHGDYHRPTDDAEKLNYPGMRKIAHVTADLTVALAEAPRRPPFAKNGPFSILVRCMLRFWGRLSGG